MTTTVLLVDDHVLIRRGLREAFEADGGFSVLGEAASVEQAIRSMAELAPMVMVIDINLPDGSGLDAVRRLRADPTDPTGHPVHPVPGIVVLSMYDDDKHLFEALEAGASAFVSKRASVEEVLSAARHAAVSPYSFTAGNLAAAMQRRMNPARPKLSPREEQVLVLLSEGLTVPVIAKRLYLSESTTKSYVSQLYEKLGSRNRSQALLQAIRVGLLKVEGEDPHRSALRPA